VAERPLRRSQRSGDVKNKAHRLEREGQGIPERGAGKRNARIPAGLKKRNVTGGKKRPWGAFMKAKHAERVWRRRLKTNPRLRRAGEGKPMG